jgi:hypothetical protein
MSMGLGNDASSSNHRLRRNARTLGTISKTFDTLAQSVAAAYYEALSEPSPDAWASLVVRAALERVNAVGSIVDLHPEDRKALAFFEAIVRENADLLASPGSVAAKFVTHAAPYASAF